MSLGGESAVDQQAVFGDKRGFGGAEPQDGIGHLFDAADSSDGMQGGKVAYFRLHSHGHLTSSCFQGKFLPSAHVEFGMTRAIHFRRVVLGEKSRIFKLRLQLPRNEKSPLAEVRVIPILQDGKLGIEGVLVPKVAQLDEAGDCGRDNDEQCDGVKEQRPFIDRHDSQT